MKKVFIFVLTFISISVMAQQPMLNFKVDQMYDTTYYSMYGNDGEYLGNDTCIVQFQSPSLYFDRAASAQLWSAGFAAGAGVFSAASVYFTRDSESVLPTVFGVSAVVCGIASFGCYLYSATNLQKASKSLSRFHFYGNGISIDL